VTFFLKIFHLVKNASLQSQSIFQVRLILVCDFNVEKIFQKVEKC